MKIDNYNFQFSPNIINLLGQELIHDKKIAIAELVKNAYDADATEVKIKISDNKIFISDNGCGMNSNTIKNYWLKPGISSKRKDGFKKTPKFQRLPLGEKGVGRLGVHRLGQEIEIISKMKQSPEVSFVIDWKDFANKDDMSELSPISVTENQEPVVFKEDKTGTQLVIKDLREHFEENDMRQLKSDLFKLLTPFENKLGDNFQIKLYDANGLFEIPMDLGIKDLKEKALFYFYFVFHKNQLVDFKYRFRPPLKSKLDHKNLTPESIQHDLKSFRADKRYTDFFKTKIDIGKVTFEGYVYEPKISKALDVNWHKQMKDYLEENGGIRVYRDGLRIYNYGEGGKDNDILDLDRKRAKRLGDNIGYNQILAVVNLNREDSRDLIEKTNREGFIHNKQYTYLTQGLDFCIEVFNYYRKIDKAKAQKLVGKEYDKADIDSKIDELIKQIDKLEIEETQKEKLKQSLFSFSQDFKQIKDIFLSAANTGLNLAFLVHEVDKIILELEDSIKNKNWKSVANIFDYLKKTIILYKNMIKMTRKESLCKLERIIEQALFSSNYRFKAHKIEVEQDITSGLQIYCKENFILGAINNLFDNAIYWLDFYQVKKKKILVKTYQENNSISIIIADNAKGFNISFGSALQPFISGRFDEGSMGIGLHLVEQIMVAHKADFNQAIWADENLPEAYKNGAILKMTFSDTK